MIQIVMQSTYISAVVHASPPFLPARGPLPICHCTVRYREAPGIVVPCPAPCAALRVSHSLLKCERSLLLWEALLTLVIVVLVVYRTSIMDEDE